MGEITYHFRFMYIAELHLPLNSLPLFAGLMFPLLLAKEESSRPSPDVLHHCYKSAS